MNIFSFHAIKYFGCRVQVETSRTLRTAVHLYTNSDPIALSHLKRGTGGRSSFNGMIATVFGANSYLGRSLIADLARTGTQIIIPYRGDPYYIREIKVSGDLGQIMFVPFHLEDIESIRTTMRYSDAVINLIGTEIDTPNFTMEQVNIDGAARLAKFAKEMDVKRFIHISALSQRENPQKYVLKTSRFRISKAVGEKEVLREFPDATIIRPADMWGDRDKFLTQYTIRSRRFNRIRSISIPIWKKGTETFKRPVNVGDVSKAIVNCLNNDKTSGKIYEAFGPHCYRLDDLVKWILFICRYFPEEVVISEMNPLFLLRIFIHQNINYMNPLLHFERLELECASDEPTNCPTLNDLNVEPKKLEDYIHHLLFYYRRFNTYWDAIGEFPEPPNPPIQVF